MPIQILPPQLANQIAAGEVVERPASVVKELVENALDAGATKVEVEIDRGGQKRILIRDNGKGIAKDELALALSRHATSKISTLDDLEAICSLGFRGEALASISSVSRLTLTSKPNDQNEAWAAIAEGLEMAVSVKPAAHPNGTTIEVLDLFFNTPARRKFLRADKTEFSHIETLIKRIALSRPDVSFVLKHNGKLVKRYRGLAEDVGQAQQMSHRLGEVINKQFVEQSQHSKLNYDEIKLAVWVKQPELCVAVNPAQYAFVNGRMMRDKLLQHAIRQGYGDNLHSEQQPEYVVSVELPATEVDVNVHPAKHEVRFHQSRLVHDLLVRTVQDAVESFYQLPQLVDEHEPEAEGELAFQTSPSSTEHISHAEQETQVQRSALVSRVDAQAPSISHSDLLQGTETLNYSGDSRTRNSLAGRPSHAPHHTVRVSNQQRQAFDKFATAVDHLVAEPSLPNATNPLVQQVSSEGFSPVTQTVQNNDKGVTTRLCFIEDCQFVYFCHQQKMYVSNVLAPEVSSVLFGAMLDRQPNAEASYEAAPLLVPVRLKISTDESSWIAKQQTSLQTLGFELKLHGQYVIIKHVPAILRSTEVSQTIPKLFESLMMKPSLSVSDVKDLLEGRMHQPTESQIEAAFEQAIKSNQFDDVILQNAKQLSGQSIFSMSKI